MMVSCQEGGLTHPLGVDLADVGKTLGQHVAWHLISKLVPKLARLALRALGKGSGIGDGACHDAANRRRDLEDVGDRLGIDEFVLFVSELMMGGGGSKPTGTFFWDRTTAQFLPRTPIDMMLAAVMALKAYSETSQLVFDRSLVARMALVVFLGTEL